MLFEMPFLTRYMGGTKRTDNVDVRWAWTSTEVEIPEADPSDFRIGAKIDDIELRHHDNGFWKAPSQDDPERHTAIPVVPRLVSDFTDAHKRSLFFHINLRQCVDFLGTSPFALPPLKAARYAPSDPVYWDQTDAIAERIAAYARDNLRIVVGELLIRTEYPSVALLINPPTIGKAVSLNGFKMIDMPYGSRAGFPTILIPPEKGETLEILRQLEHLSGDEEGRGRLARNLETTLDRTRIFEEADKSALPGRNLLSFATGLVFRNDKTIDENYLAEGDEIRRLVSKPMAEITDDVLDDVHDLMTRLSARQIGFLERRKLEIVMNAWSGRQLSMPAKFDVPPPRA